MPRVSEILAGKDHRVHTLDADTSVHAAIERMVEHNIGSLVVLDDGQIAGIFTERDFLRRVAIPDRPTRFTALREVMTTRLVCVDPETPVEECMSLMTDHRIRHLPVVREGSLLGMISIGDVVKYISDDRATEVRVLTEYITGSRA